MNIVGIYKKIANLNYINSLINFYLYSIIIEIS